MAHGRLTKFATGGFALLAFAAEALAHGVEGEVENWWQAWNWQPGPLVGIAVASLIYGTGVVRLWQAAGIGHGVARWQVGCFGGGVGFLLLALVSPLDTLAGQLGWVHMIQHTTLMLIAAPLLVAGSPTVVALWAAPWRWARSVAQAMKQMRLDEVSRYVLWQPVVLWVVFAFTLWIWHVPRLYDLALRHQLVHDVQHLAFLLGACLYWRVVLDPLGRVRLTPMLAVAHLFTISLQGMFLGVFMALSPRLWYAEYAETTAPWGLSAVEDQQIAGYIMWMPACGIYTLVAAIIFGLWLHRSARNDEASRRPDSFADGASAP